MLDKKPYWDIKALKGPQQRAGCPLLLGNNAFQKREEPMGKLIASSQILLADDTTVLWYRRQPDRTLRHVTSLPFRQFNLKRICQRCGPGRFVVYLKRDGRMIRGQTFEIKRVSVIKPRWVITWG